MIHKACPFCKSHFSETILGVDSDYYVRCNNCKARGPRAILSGELAEVGWDMRDNIPYDEQLRKYR